MRPDEVAGGDAADVAARSLVAAKSTTAVTAPAATTPDAKSLVARKSCFIY